VSREPRHLVLIGLSGSGKSTVGALVADRLGVGCVDTDSRVEAASGMSIAVLFDARGEDAFRVLERDAVRGALRESPQVIVPGGGWAAQPGALEEASDALIVHLSVTPETAATRLGTAGDRPLVSGDPQGRLANLAAARVPFYHRASHTVATDGRELSAVVDDVVALARAHGGWSA